MGDKLMGKKNWHHTQGAHHYHGSCSKNELQIHCHTDKDLKCLCKLLDHHETPEPSKNVRDASLWNCTGRINTILPKDTPSTGILIMAGGETCRCTLSPKGVDLSSDLVTESHTIYNISYTSNHSVSPCGLWMGEEITLVRIKKIIK